jgi:hypothetical protein
MSDQETREKRQRKAAFKVKFGKFGRGTLAQRYKQTDEQRYDRRAENEDNWDHADDVFHDPTDDDYRELNFHDEDEPEFDE